MKTEDYMERTFQLARQAQGNTSPNPLVGAVIVKKRKIIGEGYHQKAGKEHAEVVALKNCSESLAGATMYVNLEPCSHHGKTPPCVDTLIKSGLSKVVIAARDPNPQVNGEGIQKLQEKGVEVAVGILEEEARNLNKFFFKYITTKLPYIILKAAITIDGKIATSSGDSKWLSCEESREIVHQLRAEVDAILVGKKTILQDNPQLNSRLAKKKYPTRIVVGSSQGIPEKYHIFDRKAETIFLGENVNLKIALTNLAHKEITSLLVEGGSEVFTQFIKERLVDEFYFFITPKIIADKEAVPLMNNQKILKITDALELSFTTVEKIGEDILVKAKYKNAI